MSEFIEKIEKQIDELQSKINELEKTKSLINIFPDIKESSDRWNRKYYFSPSVNSIATNVEFRNSCGCCSDAALLVYCYVVESGIRVYSSPQAVCIGDSYVSGYGYTEREWKTELEKNNINPELFKEVEKYFKENPPVNSEDFEED